jgi:hypothetical protein
VEDAALRADERIVGVRDDSAGRYRLAREFYRHPVGPRHRYGAAELSFLRWSIARGALEPESGSPWWREVNARLLRDKVEAELLSAGVTGPPSARSVELWLGFIRTPTPASWYRAHNASIVAAYLEHEPLTAAELPVERFMMNVALIRVLYTHALLARPRLALGPLAPLGPLVADPRRRTVGLFLDLGRSFPSRLPADRFARAGHRADARPGDGLRADRAAAARALRVRGRLPRAAAAYRPVDDGTPAYAWPPEQRVVWYTGNRGRHLRAIAWVTGAGARYDRLFR